MFRAIQAVCLELYSLYNCVIKLAKVYEYKLKQRSNTSNQIGKARRLAGERD